MDAYDIFLKTDHNDYVQRLLIENNLYLIRWIKNRYFSGKDNIRMLEIGPGKGYVYKAVSKLGGGVDYYAADRNRSILSNLKLPDDKVILGSLPSIDIPNDMDIIFAGYVIEHLESGMQLYQSLQRMKKSLSENGIILLLFPDAMKLKMEFWNIDYTHCFPTTKRNVNQAACDCGLRVVDWADLSGVLYSKKINSRFLNGMHRGLTSLYSYNLFSFLARPIYKKPLWNLSNVFWRFYGMIKEYNVMFILREDKD